MQRRERSLNDPKHGWVPGISDEEALIIQLCDFLYDSGFLFNDARPDEMESGNQVMLAFSEQEPDFLDIWVVQNRFDHFLQYVQSHNWSPEATLQKLRLKIIKAFDQLAQGSYHSFNIRRNIHIGLIQYHQHILQDFLLYVKTYLHFLEEESEPPESLPNTSIADVMKMREELINRIEGSKFVDLLLKGISQKRRGHLPKEVAERVKKKENVVEFVRPSQGPRHPPHQTQPTKTVMASGQTAGQSASPQKSETTKPISEKKSLKESLNLEIEDDFIDELDSGEQSAADEDSDVIYGTGAITKDACMKFIRENPDSAVKFLYRRDLTEKHLPDEISQIYEGWEKRGLHRGFVRKIILEIMEWENLPADKALLEIAGDIKDRLYDLSHGGVIE